jgi:hypothetical protein
MKCDGSACEPLTLPSDVSAMAGWQFCSLPPDPGDPVQAAPPGAAESPQDADSASARPGAPSPADALPGDPLPAWDDDREWLRLWRTAGPALTDRERVARAWIAAAPPQPLPRTLAAVELCRIAARHRISVEVAFQNGPPARPEDAQERDLVPTRPEEPPHPAACPGGFPVPEDDTPPDPATAPVGRCRRCGWITPLTARRTCWGCETGDRP